MSTHRARSPEHHRTTHRFGVNPVVNHPRGVEDPRESLDTCRWSRQLTRRMGGRGGARTWTKD